MTERAEHTAGPWEFETDETPSGQMFTVYDEHGVRLSDAYIDERPARLIAAAPDLLAALRVALPCLAHKVSCHTTRPTSEWEKHGSSSFDRCDCEIKAVRAAIAKATGEA